MGGGRTLANAHWVFLSTVTKIFMMRLRLFTTFFLTLLLTLSASAKPRTMAQLRAIAARELSVSTTVEDTRGTSISNMETLQQLSDLIVIGNRHVGFVVLANDDAIEAVVGVSNKPYTNDTNINPAFQWYLRAANAAIATRIANGQHYSAAIAPAAPLPDHVAPLIKTKWHQEAPFNNDVQKDANGNPYLVGCVAITMTQIMRYYKYPTKGIGSNTYSMNGETLTADFSASPYQWDKMLPIYEKGKYTDEEAKAVSELMRQVGISVNMDYKPNFSSSYTKSAQNALINNFGYNPNMNRYTRNYYSEQEWMDMVYKELSEQRPIYYSGNDSKGKNGHAFVINGYNAEGKVYVNWGWGGYEDGYFDIGILTPKNSGDYSYYQDMIVGIQPEQQGAWMSHLTLDYGNHLTIKKLSRRAISMGEAKVCNVSSTPVNGTLALVIEGNGQQRDLETKSYQAKDSYWKAISWERILIPADLPDGDYQVYLRFKDDRDANWQVVRSEYGKPNSVMINIANGTFTVKGNRTNYDWVTAIEAPMVSDAEAPVSVYNLQGHKLLQLPAAAFSVNQLPTHGIFIIKQGTKTTKVVR
ncbi:putative thiol protease/hemagglutinin PrtT [Hoylesella timonensis CRIS 5C-B1]|uniref:Putative thiol protease/hemagglutinin PrtT n=2 Tax=Hoylesella timonensis TaxID=386414 RepID=D1VXQ6_9BACT|nr:putative thiol protease/hemagglutinin PrtT [Hoylesella timonensis CRIS 5C-B1]